MRGLFLDFKLLKGALCATISPWDSGVGSRALKQSSLFISWKASEQVSQSEPVTNGCRRKAREIEGVVHDYWPGEILHIYITCSAAVI